MKTKLLGMLFIAAAVFSGIQAVNLSKNDAQTVKKNFKPIVITTWQAGSFSAGIFGCWGDGFCRKDIVMDDGKKIVTPVTNNENGTVTVVFDTKTFNEQNQEYYRDRNVFACHEDFKLTLEECTGLRLPFGTVISKGLYPIQKDEAVGTLTVVAKIMAGQN